MTNTVWKVRLKDDSEIGVSFFESKKEYTQATVLLFPAMGVAASYYTNFAEQLSLLGIHVVTADLRGLGLSPVRASKKVDYGYYDIIENEYEGIVRTVQTRLPDEPLYIMGHSLGGQLASLFYSKHQPNIKGLILVASCSVYYKGWNGLGRIKILFASQFFRLISKLFGYFPGKKVGFGGTEAKTQMQDWGKNAVNGKYILSGTDFDFEKGLSVSKLPILAISIKGDDFAPEKAVKNLYQKFDKESPITHLHLGNEELELKKVNHFNWAKQPGKLPRVLMDWMAKTNKKNG